jgi:predicted MFS family arabinose efflux permease
MTEPQTNLYRNPDFMRLWIAQGVSAFGGRFTRTALPIVAIGGLAATPGEVGVLSALGFVPSVLVGLFLGGWIDRRPKRPLLIAMDLARALCMAAIPLAWAIGLLNIWWLYMAAVLSGAGTAVFQTADNAFLPSLIPKDALVDGNSKLETTESVAEIAGPGLAGVVIQFLGWPVAMAADALSYLWSAWWLGRISNSGAPEKAEPAPPSVFADIAAGLRLCWSHDVVRPLLAASTVQAFFGGFFMTLYMVFALKVLNLGEAAIGLIIGVGGIGALIGVAMVGPTRRALGYGGAMLCALALGQLASLLIPLSAAAGALQIPVLVAHQLIGDGALTVFFVLAGSLRQSVLPQDMLGRAHSAFSVTGGVAITAGALISGWLANAIGTTPAVWIGVLGGLLAVTPLAASRVAGMAGSDKT